MTLTRHQTKKPAGDAPVRKRGSRKALSKADRRAARTASLPAWSPEALPEVLPEELFDLLADFAMEGGTGPVSPASPVSQVNEPRAEAGGNPGECFRVRTRRNLRPPIDLRGKTLDFERGIGSVWCAEKFDADADANADADAQDCEVLETAFVGALRAARVVPGGGDLWDVTFHEALAGGALYSPNMFQHMTRA